MDLCNQIICFLFQFSHKRGISISFILARIQIIDNLLDGTSRNSAELDVLLKMPAAMTLGNVIGNGNGSSLHLLFQTVSFLRWQ